MKMNNWETTIQEILNLEPSDSEQDFYEPFEEFSIFTTIAPIADAIFRGETLSQLTTVQVIDDRVMDTRARQLHIVQYKGQPFALYQYIGKGEYVNDVIFDVKIYSQFVSDAFSEYLKGKNLSLVGKDAPYTIFNYDDIHFEIRNNTLFALRGR